MTSPKIQTAVAQIDRRDLVDHGLHALSRFIHAPSRSCPDPRFQRNAEMCGILSDGGSEPSPVPPAAGVSAARAFESTPVFPEFSAGTSVAAVAAVAAAAGAARGAPVASSQRKLEPLSADRFGVHFTAD